MDVVLPDTYMKGFFRSGTGGMQIRTQNGKIYGDQTRKAGQLTPNLFFLLELLVGARGFEPPTP